MYHFFSEPGGGGGTIGPPSVDPPLLALPPLADAFVSACSTGGSLFGFRLVGLRDALSINQLRDVRPNEVEQTEDRAPR